MVPWILNGYIWGIDFFFLYYDKPTTIITFSEDNKKALRLLIEIITADVKLLS